MADDDAQRVNRPETAEELEALRRSCRRGSPLGPPDWASRVAAEMGIGHTLRPRGRPKKRLPAAEPSEIGS